MNFKHLLSLTVATAGVALSFSSVPAQAFSFGTNGIQFDSDTTVNFKFVESHGAFSSALQVFESNNLTQSVARLFWETKQSDNGGSNEWKGTFGNAVTSESGKNPVSFTFKAGINYTLGLLSTLSGGSQGTVYSTNNFNTATGGSQQAVFANFSTLQPVLNPDATTAVPNPANYSSGNPFAAGGVLIGFDDRGNSNDTDFQDFVVQAEAVPEPFTLGGIALAGAGLAYARRLRHRPT